MTVLRVMSAVWKTGAAWQRVGRGGDLIRFLAINIHNGSRGGGGRRDGRFYRQETVIKDSY